MSLFDGQTQYPAGYTPYIQPEQSNMPMGQQPQAGDDIPVMNGVPDVNSANGASIPSYTGNPVLDQYIHKFIGV